MPMPTARKFNIAVFEGDGIGPEITAPCCELLKQACLRVTENNPSAGIELEMNFLPAGANAFKTMGSALPSSSVDAARKADAILLSAMGDPEVRYADGTELTPQIDMRFELGLYAGLRPIRSIPGVPGPLADPRAKNIDFVLVRESIEGLFAPQAPGKMMGDEQAEETLVITRAVSEKLFEKTFALAEQRQAQRKALGGSSNSRVTCIDKANVFQAFAFFRKIFYEVAEQKKQTSTMAKSKNANDAEPSSLSVDHAYVDIMSLNLVTRPWEYDVMVTENMFGDILSDLGAALIGGMGYAPSADLGDDHAVFQPCHGTAPDIAGKGLANPTAMFLSGAMMLDWLANRHQCQAAATAANLINRSVDAAFAQGDLKTVELGGQSDLKAVHDAVTRQLSSLAVE
ncbi:MAG: isocitrate/isopropylmalate dehydrogenase family protein [Granulosicoccus sp.]